MLHIHRWGVAALCCAVVFCLSDLSPGQTVFDWNGSSGNLYGDVFNWTPLGVPNTASETARFDIAGSYDVTLTSAVTTTVSDLIVNDGDITFAANAAIFATYATDDDALIEGGDFTLSQTAGSGDVVMNVGDRMLVSSDSQVLVSAGSDLNVSGNLQVGTLPFADALMTIGNPGSTLDVTGNVSLGASGATGRLVIEGEAMGDIQGMLDVGVSSANGTTGELSVLTAADLTTGSIRVGTGTAAALAQQAQVFVNGQGTSLTMTGAATLEVGSATNPNVTAELFVQNFGQFTTGTGAIDIVGSGRLVIAGSSLFTNNGQLTVDGGTIDQLQFGGFINGAGSSLTATNEAQLNFTSDQRINNGVTWTLQDGAVYTTDTTFDDLAIGQTTDGALIVENSGASVDLSAGGSGIVGSLGGTGTMTVRDSATATFGRLVIGSSATAGTTGVLNVEDGASVDTDELEVAELAGPTTSGTVNLGGAGALAQLIVNGTGTIDVGNFSPGNGSGVIDIAQGGELVGGGGLTTIRQTGTIAINAGAFQAGGDVLVDGGELRETAGNFNLQPGLTLTAQNAGQVNLNSHFLNNDTTFLIQSDADFSTTSSLFVGANPGQSGELIVEGAGSTLDVGTTFVVGTVGGTGVVTLRDGAAATLNLTSIGIAPDNEFSSGEVRVESGATVTSSDLRIGRDGGAQAVGSLVVTGVGSSWEAGALTLGHAFAGQATVEVAQGGVFSTTSTATLNPTGIMTIDGGTVTLDSHVAAGGKIDLVSGSLTSGSDWVVQTGGVLGHVAELGPGATLATAGAAQGVVIETGSVLALNGGTLDVGSITNNGGTFLFNSGTLELTGGVSGLTNFVVPTNGALLATGVYAIPFTALGGSTVTSTGDLTLGDASSVAGFYANGAVSIASGTTTLLDANDAVFDSAANVTLGDGTGGSANLTAAGGLTLDFGGNLTGFGTVNTPNDATTPVINNGHIVGRSLAEPITLTGYVKGVGTADNVVIAGTDAPGFSPATVLRGSVRYDGTLEIEIGGNSLGNFDRLEHILGAGVAELGGVLDVDLINGFLPSAGDTFEILTAASILGTFVVEDLPDLGGLQWEVDYSATSVLLSVISPFTADFDLDGDVDAADLAQWQSDYGTNGNSDADADADTDGRDWLAWQQQFGSGVPLAASQTVPEPGSMGLLIAVVGTLVTFSRRR